MLERIAIISSRNQITLPADIRHHLGVGPSDKIAFVVGTDGKVEVRRPRYDLESVLGSLPAIPGASLDLKREIEVATEEAMREKARRKRW